MDSVTAFDSSTLIYNQPKWSDGSLQSWLKNAASGFVKVYSIFPQVAMISAPESRVDFNYGIL